MLAFKKIILITIFLLISVKNYAQNPNDWKLEKMPADLETDFALSALPPHLRQNATVYLLNPEIGYYVAKKGTNGFGAFVIRTEWEWAEFVQDIYTAISYDAEGLKTYLPVYFEVAKMRASGKYSAQQIKDRIIKKIKNGTYKAPEKFGLSYMLSTIQRTHLDNRGIVTQNLPHYMFYAPRVDNNDIGGMWDGHNPFAISSGNFLEKKYSIMLSFHLVTPKKKKQLNKIKIFMKD